MSNPEPSQQPSSQRRQRARAAGLRLPSWGSAAGVGLVAVLVAGAISCNAVLGAGAVAVVGGAGYLAGQCYDSVRVRVIDAQTGRRTCDAEVRVTSAEGSARSLRPCYHVALTEGHWTLTAKQPGYAPATTEVDVPKRSGSCPRYTHSVEFTLLREGVAAGATARRVVPPSEAGSTPAASSAASAPPDGLDATGSTPASQRAGLTRGFGNVSLGGADAGAPR